MSNKLQIEWNELWAAFSAQPVVIQSEWMLGLRESIEDATKRSMGLYSVLTDVMKYSTQEVKDEVFEAAPDDVKKFFGYKAARNGRNTKAGYGVMSKEQRQSILRLLG